MKNPFGSFKQAGKVIDQAKNDVRRPKDEVAQQRQKNQQGGGKK